MQEERTSLINSTLVLHSTNLASITLQAEPQLFLDQVKSTSNEEVHIEHHEQEFWIQI